MTGPVQKQWSASLPRRSATLTKLLCSPYTGTAEQPCDGQTGPVTFAPPPRSACWRHTGLRVGFEVAYFTCNPDGLEIRGTTTGIQDDDPWIVSYTVTLDDSWHTRAVRVMSTSIEAVAERLIDSDGQGHWTVDGKSAIELDGCLDVDLESSAMTNALPVHRLDLAVGDTAAAPAAYLRAPALEVERLEQHYTRIDDQDGLQRYDYQAPRFDFRSVLSYDRHGLVLHYPGIAERAQ